MMVLSLQALTINRALFKGFKMAAQLHEICPHLVPQDRTRRHYSGYISVQVCAEY